MSIDWTHFTPWSALAGGVLLGLASALFILLNGRILGISGILAGLLPAKAGDVFDADYGDLGQLQFRFV